VHVVLFKLKDSSNAGEVCRRLKDMEGKIPQLRYLSAGMDILKSQRSYDMSVRESSTCVDYQESENLYSVVKNMNSEIRMNIPVEKWHAAIPKRCSRRQYEAVFLSPETVDYLIEFCDSINSVVDGARVVFVNLSPDKLYKGFIGSYGKIQYAPAYVAIIGDNNDKNVQEKAGYIGECFILEATAMGLGTCWLGGTFDSQIAGKGIDIGVNEKIFAISPVGFAKMQVGFGEKLVKFIAKSQKRKSLEELCPNQDLGSWPDWAKKALEAARLAPSAVNRQPWRFTVEGDSIKVSVDDPKNLLHISKRLDCGIAMLHLEVGALYAGVTGKWEYLDSPVDVAIFKLI
jgi:hypothetical protein